MFLNISVESILEYFFEMIFPFFSFFLMGFIFIFIGRRIKNKYDKKLASAVDAKVLKIEEDLITSGRYLIYLEYLYGGRVITGIYKGFVKYHIGSTVKVFLYGDKPGEILSDVPSDVDEDIKAINWKFHQVMSFIGKFLIVFGIICFLENSFNLTGESIYYKLILTIIFGILIKVMFSSKKKASKELELLKTDKYELIKTKVIGFKPGYKLFHFKPIQFPVIEFEDNGNKVEKLLKEDVIINHGKDQENGVILVFRNKVTGKIFSESSLKDKESIYNTIIGISIAVYIISIILS